MLRVVAVVVVALLAACDGPIVDPPAAGTPTARLGPDAVAPDLGDAPAADPLPVDVPDDVTVLDLGLVGLRDGRSGQILVDVGRFAAMAVLVYGHAGTTVILERAEAPSGEAVVSDAVPDDLPEAHVQFARGFPAQVFSVNRVLGADVVGAFLLPNTPLVAPAAGTWRLRVGAYAVDALARPPTRSPVDRPVRVLILVKTEDPGRARLDLNLHFATPQLPALLAPSEAIVTDALEVVRGAYDAVGVEIGDLTFTDVDPSFAIVALADDRCDGGDLDALAAEGRGAPPGADVFFVEGFSCVVNGVDVGSGIGGLAAGIPAPPWVHGSPRSAVAIALPPDSDGEALGAVLAHELGHFLGLFHTREAGLFGADAIFDEIDDTDDDAGANLMYFAVDDVTTLSPGQGVVLRSSPLTLAVQD